MKLAVHQPNYVPWCGYFAKICQCDIFVFLDNVQMPGGQSYVYRAQIKNGTQPKWLSVPTQYHFGDLITEVHFAKPDWATRHLDILKNTYARTPYFKEVFSFLKPLYEQSGNSLSEFNQCLIQNIAAYLNIKCQFEVSSKLFPDGYGDDRLISLAKILKTDTYISGKGGTNYQDPSKFTAAGIELDVRVYTPIAYDQGNELFIPGLSILDALFYLGPSTIDILHY